MIRENVRERLNSVVQLPAQTDQRINYRLRPEQGRSEHSELLEPWHGLHPNRCWHGVCGAMHQQENNQEIHLPANREQLLKAQHKEVCE